MTQSTDMLVLQTNGPALIEFTREVESWVEGQDVTTGLVTLFCRHTSASILIQENAAPEVQQDLIAWFDRAVPEGNFYAHDTEGPDDMPAHIRSALTQTHLAIPVMDGRLALGTWQGIYLFEHRRKPHRREIVMHLAF